MTTERCTHCGCQLHQNENEIWVDDKEVEECGSKFHEPVELCKCGGTYDRSRYCGVKVCDECGNHKGLARCYCGWSLTSPGHGEAELQEMGENTNEDY